MILDYAQCLDTIASWEYERLEWTNCCNLWRTVRWCMEINGEKLEQTVLALLQMNLSDDSGRRAWKSLPWSALDSLHQKGYISDPATKNKSVWLTEEGAKLSKDLFEKLFAAEYGNPEGMRRDYT